MRIASIHRTPVEGDEEALLLHSGVNILVGPPNSGKTTWLSMLDYAFGDQDSPAKAMGKVASKYKSVRVEILLGEKSVNLERRWGANEVQSLTWLDGVGHNQEEFADEFLKLLNWPLLRFPPGSPYAPKQWSRLSWRILYRHIYRHEYSWNDIAAKQPPAEQAASIMFLLGGGAKLYPPEFERMIELEKELYSTQARRDQFESALQDVTREIVALDSASVALTPSAIEFSRQQLLEGQKELEAARTHLLRAFESATQAEQSKEEIAQREVFERASRHLADLRARRQSGQDMIAVLVQRQRELEQHRQLVNEEVEKLQRSKDGQSVLADLRITHCPNCDQPIRRTVVDDSCMLCLQPMAKHGSEFAIRGRLDFEELQLKSELQELSELVGKLQGEAESERRRLRHSDLDIRTIEEQLRPVQMRSTPFIPPELGLVERELGRGTERLDQLKRIEVALEQRTSLSSKVDKLNAQVALLNADVQQITAKVEYSKNSDLLADAMNDYLNRLNAGEGPPRWPGGRVGVMLGDRDTRITVNGHDWTKEVGGTYKCFLLAAYNYALLSITGVQGSLYPGFSVIDLPPNMTDNRILSEQENYLAEPFIELLSESRLKDAQLILTGHSYSGLKGIHRIDLTQVYAPGIE